MVLTMSLVYGYFQELKRLVETKNILSVTIPFEQQIFNHKYYQHGKNYQQCLVIENKTIQYGILFLFL